VKRALTATIFGGMLIFCLPHAASAETTSSHRMGAYEAPPADSGHDQASKPAEDSSQPKKDAPGEGKSHYDKLHHDGDTF